MAAAVKRRNTALPHMEEIRRPSLDDVETCLEATGHRQKRGSLGETCHVVERRRRLPIAALVLHSHQPHPRGIEGRRRRPALLLLAGVRPYGDGEEKREGGAGDCGGASVDCLVLLAREVHASLPVRRACVGNTRRRPRSKGLPHLPGATLEAKRDTGSSASTDSGPRRLSGREG